MSSPQPHNVVREKGDGSREEADDLYEGAAYRHDERAPTDTTFFESDINQLQVSQRRKNQLKRMMRRQEGENPGEPYQQGRRMRADANRDEWKRRVVSTYASYVELTRHQKERAKHLVEDVLNFSGFSHYSQEQAILGVINVVAREDGRWLEDEDSFRRLMQCESLTPEDVRRLRGMVRSRL